MDFFYNNKKDEIFRDEYDKKFIRFGRVNIEVILKDLLGNLNKWKDVCLCSGWSIL